MNSEGTPVAQAQLLREGEKPSLPLPFILKPCSEDNSMGITLVEKTDDVEKALAAAFKFDDEILCEQYIPLGRELRVGVLQQADGSLRFLPAIDYHLPAEKPIRTSADKIGVDEKGIPATFTAASRTCPAVLDSKLAMELESAAFAAHTALGCRDYSL